MTSKRVGRLAATLALVGALGCGDDPGKTTDIAFSDFEGPGVGVTLELSGLVVEMDPSVHYESHFHSETGKPTVRTQTMNGLPFELVTGGFTLGDRSYDGLESGDRVLITADGILVNGQERWEFPDS